MPQTILITGASGFVGTHITRTFLEKGYHVRATARSESSGQNLLLTHKGFEKQLTLAIVPDLVRPGAFDEAVNGVDGIIHTASPFVLDATDYEKDLYHPAVQGTTSILEAACKNNPNVKRVVITSSFAAVLDPVQGLRPGYAYSESDWNPVTKDKVSDGVAAYLASKTFAEQVAWNFVKENSPPFSIATLTPPMVYGPIIHHVSNMKKLNTSAQDIYRLFNGTTKEVPDTAFWAFIDVRDLAKAHLLAYEKETAANERYLVASSAYSFQQICDIIRGKFPNLRDKTPAGDTGAKLPPTYTLDTTKAKQQLGITFTPLEKTVVDTVNALLELRQKLGEE